MVQISMARALVLSLLLGAPFFADGDISLLNWTAPPYWQGARAEGQEAADRARSGPGKRETLALPSAALPFIAIPPCRVADTRDPAFPPAFGIPMLNGGGAARPFVIPSGPCPGLPVNAGAWSLNFTVVAPPGTPAGGYLSVWPTGSSQPIVSTLNFTSNSILANAAVVPAGTGGSINTYVNFSTDLIIDINGYYAGTGLVTSLNTLAGDVTLSPGSNVTITPSGSTLTIAATGGPGGILPTGTSGQTLRSNGTSWLAVSNLYNNGTNIGIGTSAPSEQLEITGNLRLPVTTSTAGQIRLGANRFLHGFGTSNTFVGSNTGNFTMGGTGSEGAFNTAVGSSALSANTTGFNNVAVGAGSLQFNMAGAHNTAIGTGALFLNQTGNENTAVGSASLSGSTGEDNTAVGKHALVALTSGNNNVALGAYAGSANSGGSANVYISSSGVNLESGKIHIGTSGTQDGAFIAGIRGVTTVNADALPVLIDSAGQLGTTSSSLRFKEEVREMGDASAAVLQLRPVTFRYGAHRGQPGATQFGLIAEEVDAVIPELVARSADGEVETVKYHQLPAMLLNELQKAVRRIEELEREVESLKAAARDGRR